MAESVIYHTMTEILKKLGLMVNQEIKLMWGAKNELHKLENTVSRIKALLVDAEKQQATNHEVADWLEKLNDVFYDARELLDDFLDDSQVHLRRKAVRTQNKLAFNRKMARQIKAIRERLDARDLLDDFSTQTQALRRKAVMTRSQSKRVKKVRTFFSSFSSHFSRKMARQIKAIRERLDAIACDNKFHFTQCPIMENSKRDETHSFVHEQTVIGRDADKAQMVNLLLNSNNVQEKDIILPILRLSYDSLPSHLKECFAFCSLYLKDEEIHKRELIQLWIAHGLIQSGYENQTLEDVGNLYFMDLLKRSLFQNVKKDEWGDIKSCKMHDLVHHVAESVVRPKGSVVNSNAENITEGTRHLSLHLSGEIPTQLFRAHKLRTLKMVVKSEFGIDQDFERIISNFKRLRVLNVDDLKMNVAPSNVSKMKYLRYLDLSGSAIKNLSSSVTKLQNLQTLKLNGCRGLEQLPGDIKKLVSLRHLELDRCFRLTGMPCGLGQLTCLLTLTLFVAGSHSGLSELQSLNNLGGRLFIKIRQGEDLKKATTAAEGRMQRGTNYLEAKQYLKTLALWFDWNENNGVLLESLRPHPNLKELNIFYYGGVSFPSWMMVDKIGLSSALPNLVRLSLHSCKRCEHLPLFGQLPSLQFLSLWGMKSVEYIDDSSSIGSGGEESSGGRGGGIRISEPTPTFFPSLKELELYGLPKLKGWWRSEASEEETKATATLLDQDQHQHLKLPSFPSLSILTIEECPNLASMPILQPCLEQLELGGVSKKLLEQELIMTTTDTIATSSSSSLQFPQGLSNLTDLIVTEIPKMVSLPVGLKHLTTLRTLEIESCDDLIALPEWIGNLTSLGQLQIEGCPKLTSLPDGMRQLTALQQLTIGYCSQVLYDRCQRETGEDWPKIAHIPNVHVSPSQI